MTAYRMRRQALKPTIKNIGVVAGRSGESWIIPANLPGIRFFFFPGSRFVFLLNRSGSANGNVLAKSLHGTRPDAMNFLQIARRFKRPILLAMIDNGFRFGRANSLKGLKLGLSCGINI